MKETPILFSGDMVRAILSGAKTQTRRPVKQPIDQDFWSYARPGVWEAFDPNRGEMVQIGCPYGIPGDRLWVRETFYCDDAFAGDYTDPGCVGAPRPRAKLETVWRESLYYRADGEPIFEFDEGSKWRPSIHMPRWASRITLPVVAVRIERVQDITEADARAEGVEPAWLDENGVDNRKRGAEPTFRKGFIRAWSEIYSRESWEANPWVWVLRWEKAEVRP